MVEIRNARSHGIPEGFGGVKAGSSCVRSRNKKPPKRVQHPVGCRPFRLAVITRIFLQNTRKDGRGHIRPYRIVGKRSAESFAISVPALPPGFRRIFRLSNSGKRSIKRKRKIIERLRGGGAELLPGCHRRKIS